MADRQVLEVGCGDGRITTLLANHSETLIAIDPDPDMLKEARSNVSGVDFREANGEDLPFSDSSFDIVLFTLSLHHQDSAVALGEARRVLKDGGLILVVEPAHDGEVEQVFTLVHDETRAKEQAQLAIRDSGLILEKEETVYAQWQFDDKDELCQSLFDYYAMDFDSDIADRIAELLGAKSESSPIVLEDILIIQSLVKPD